MSEYQYVAFRAIDRPVSEKDLRFMRRQSSSAEITPWTFEKEYNFGDFGGDAVEMLRRGYDIHLHYANFGIRKLLIRLPSLPDAGAFQEYFSESVQFLKDEQGTGGILAIEPFHEPGDLDELWELDTWLERLAPLRAEILNGDLRALYLAHLADDCDPEETLEAPVPAGLESLTDAQAALAEWYGLGDDLVAAAAQYSPPLPHRDDSTPDYSSWLERQSQATKDGWLSELISDPNSAVRAEILAMYRADRTLPIWPTRRSGRTIAELHAAAAQIASAMRRRKAEKAGRQRAQHLASLAADPQAILRKTERLVAERSTQAYREVAQLLADLREALSAGGRARLADEQAKKLQAANPRLHVLTSELRRKGFLPK